MKLFALIASALAFVQLATAHTYFLEQFDDGAKWTKRWTQGDAKAEFVIGKGDIYADEEAVRFTFAAVSATHALTHVCVCVHRFDTRAINHAHLFGRVSPTSVASHCRCTRRAPFVSIVTARTFPARAGTGLPTPI
jgi:hypothetical protein